MYSQHMKTPNHSGRCRSNKREHHRFIIRVPAVAIEVINSAVSKSVSQNIKDINRLRSGGGRGPLPPFSPVSGSIDERVLRAESNRSTIAF